MSFQRVPVVHPRLSCISVDGKPQSERRRSPRPRLDPRGGNQVRHVVSSRKKLLNGGVCVSCVPCGQRCLREKARDVASCCSSCQSPPFTKRSNSWPFAPCSVLVHPFLQRGAHPLALRSVVAATLPRAGSGPPSLFHVMSGQSSKGPTTRALKHTHSLSIRATFFAKAYRAARAGTRRTANPSPIEGSRRQAKGDRPATRTDKAEDNKKVGSTGAFS